MAVLAVTAWAAPEILKGVRYRAVTLAHEERKQFKIPEVERLQAVQNESGRAVTGSCCKYLRKSSANAFTEP